VPAHAPDPTTVGHGAGEGLTISLLPQPEARVEEVVHGNVAHRRHPTQHISILSTGVVGEEGVESWRFCVNFRALNVVTVKNKFPIPVVEELLGKLRRETFFSKLDWRLGYHHVLMHLADVEKTTFMTHEGSFEFLVMPFSLTNVSATFQPLMKDVLC
jgi:hypothetical protein